MSHPPHSSTPWEQPASMRALTQERYGPLSALQWRDRPVPALTPGRVLVRAEYAGIDPSIWHLMTGNPLVVRAFAGLRGPRRPVAGQDLSGTIVAVGADVDPARVGQQVWGCASGALAEFALARAENVLPLPEGSEQLDSPRGAALATSGTTALQAVRAARLRPGASVAVLGAGGGVGCLSVQLAVQAGAVVTGVCSAAKAAAVRSWGASEVIDYRERDLLDRSERYDAIIDCAGNRGLRDLRNRLTERGTLVIVGGEFSGTRVFGVGRLAGATVLSPLVKNRLVGLVATVRPTDLAELAGLVDSGQLQVPLDRTLPASQAVAAIEYVQSGAATGKVVVDLTAS